jgi:hypothetical protein
MGMPHAALHDATKPIIFDNLAAEPLLCRLGVRI